MPKIPTNNDGLSLSRTQTPRMGRAEIGPAVAAASRAASAAGGALPKIQIPKIQPANLDLSGVNRGIQQLAGVANKRSEERRQTKNKIAVFNASTAMQIDMETWLEEERKNPVGLTLRMKDKHKELQLQYMQEMPDEDAVNALDFNAQRIFLGAFQKTLGVEALASKHEKRMQTDASINNALFLVIKNPQDSEARQALQDRLKENVDGLVSDGSMNMASSADVSKLNQWKNSIEVRLVEAQVEELTRLGEFSVARDVIKKEAKNLGGNTTDMLDAISRHEDQAIRSSKVGVRNQMTSVIADVERRGDDGTAATVMKANLPLMTEADAADYTTKIQIAQAKYKAGQKANSMSPAEIAANLQSSLDQVDSGTGSGEEWLKLQAEIDVWRERQAEFTRQPIDYAIKYAPAVQDAWDKYTLADDKDPAKAAYLDLYKDEAKKWWSGVATDGGSPSDMPLLPSTELRAISRDLKSMKSDQQVETLLNLRLLHKDDFPHLLRSLGQLPEGEEISKRTVVAAALIDAPGGLQIAQQLMKLAADDVKPTAEATTTAKDVMSKLGGNYDNMVDTLRYADPFNAARNNMVGAMRETIMDYMTAGGTEDKATMTKRGKQIVDALFTDRYHMVERDGKYVIPRREIGRDYRISGYDDASVDAIENVSHYILRGIPKTRGFIDTRYGGGFNKSGQAAKFEQFLPTLNINTIHAQSIGLAPGASDDEWNRVMGTAEFVNNANNTGIYVQVQNKNTGMRTAVLDKRGNRLEFGFDELVGIDKQMLGVSANIRKQQKSRY